MRRQLALLLTATSGFLVALAGPAALPAYACDQEAAPFRTQLRQAEVVFRGTVDQKIAGDGDRNVYVVAVDRVYRGEVATETTVTSPDTHAECGLRRVQQGEKYLFVAGAQQSGVVHALSHEGTRPQTRQVVRRVTDVLGEGQPPVPPSELQPQEGEEPGLERVDASEPPGLARSTLPGAVLAGLGLLVLLGARLLGRGRP